MEREFNRRSFLKGSLIATAGIAAAGLAGCAPQTPASTLAETGNAEKSDSAPAAPENIVETVDTELLVIGAGCGGLACAVQGALNGTQVLLLEKGTSTGGNANVSEGMFALGTDRQKELGIELSVPEIINHEMEFAQFRVDGQLWRDFVENSVENYEWCKEQGVEFSGVVNDYGGLYETMHWFKGDTGAGGYVPQMTARAEELGVEIRCSTPAYRLIQDESGTVVGAYAKNPDGDDIQINAKATVIATGGWGCNEELIQRMGFDTTDWMQCGLDNHDGDGYTMAMEVGAKDMAPFASQLALNYIPALPRQSFTHPYNGIGGIASGLNPVVWVNEEAQRFSNECLWKKCIMYQALPAREQKEHYTIFDSAIWHAVTAEVENADQELEEALEKNTPESIWAADTIEGLAEAVGLDPQALKKTIDEYNGWCEAGIGDQVFGKAAEDMAPISTPPFYIARTRLNFVTNFGGIGTNRKREVITEEGEAIPGLYAAGLDGDMRYRNAYPINCGGTTFAGFLYNGRIAANNAKAYMAELA